jgi:hypothetical protein
LIPVLLIASLFLAAACGAKSDSTTSVMPKPATAPATAAADTPEPAPTPTASPTPQPTPTPEPTPTPTPEPTPAATADPATAAAAEAEQLLAAVAQNLSTMSTATFSMVDETESGAPFFGATLKRMEAVVKAPDSLRMNVDVVAPGFGFVKVEIVQVGDQAFIKLTEEAPWLQLPQDQVPFDFAGMAKLFGSLPGEVEDLTVTGQETIQGAPAIVLEGVVQSEALSDLITTEEPGHPVNLTLWIDPEQAVLRQVRLEGQILTLDDPETSRLITIEDINVPVDIELPDLTAGR